MCKVVNVIIIYGCTKATKDDFNDIKGERNTTRTRICFVCVCRNAARRDTSKNYFFAKQRKQNQKETASGLCEPRSENE